MLPWRAVLGAAAVLGAFAAGWISNGWRIENGTLKAEREASANAVASNQTIIAAYRQELERVRNRPPRRVLLCHDVPGAASGTPDPAEAGAGGGAGRDIGPVLAECRQYVAQLGALIEAVRAVRHE